MAVIIDRVMDYQTKAENTFANLGTAYYTDLILRVAQAGVMQGDGKNVRPKDKITREEAVSMLARALSVTVGGSLTNFADNSRISSWAMSNVAAFAENGYIAGRSGNRFEPKANITRAEVVKLLDNMISDYITESGTATPKGTGIVIVKASGVTLNKAKLSSTVVLGGKAGEVKATDCEITGKVVKIHNSALVTSGSTSTGRLDRRFFRRFFRWRLVCTGSTECIPAPQGSRDLQEPGRIQLRHDLFRHADCTGWRRHLLRGRGRCGQGSRSDHGKQKV